MDTLKRRELRDEKSQYYIIQLLQVFPITIKNTFDSNFSLRYITVCLNTLKKSTPL